MAVLEGKVWRYGDNIDTDVIIPARYLNTFDPKELASHCMVDIDETFAKEVKPGDIMVGGKNFGCGSSREHAPVAIKASGVPVIIAASFARIFTGTASTWDCRFWKSEVMWKKSTKVTGCLWTFPPAPFGISPPVTFSRHRRFPVSSRTSPKPAGSSIM